ncbi:MAG: helix-turn-helix transcriptional regulator [Bacteroidales bacterium]|nr:helix-turn-helix transcriptional regulator [Bacteroidales bacterium]
MNYKEIHTTGKLSAFVKYFWRYEHSGEDIEYTILPDACFDIVVDFENNELENIYLTGIWTQPIKLIVTKGATLFGIRFKIIAAEYLLNREIKSLLNGMTILSKDFWNIHLAQSTDFEQFSIDLTEQMIGILNQQPEIDNRKLKLFNLIYSEQFQRVTELSEITGWNNRQINRYFNQQFGFPLKTLLNIVRCNASYPNIVEGKLYPVKEYTDQAHFIKEIKKYTENSPSQLYKNENDRFLQLSAFKVE